MSLIVLHTCTCEVIHLYRNKLDVVDREEGGPGGEGPGSRSGGGGGTSPNPGAGPLSEGFSTARRGKIKCNFTAAPRARAATERLLCLFHKYIFSDAF